jgi:hypothetical protein
MMPTLVCRKCDGMAIMKGESRTAKTPDFTCMTCGNHVEKGSLSNQRWHFRLLGHPWDPEEPRFAPEIVKQPQVIRNWVTHEVRAKIGAALKAFRLKMGFETLRSFSVKTGYSFSHVCHLENGDCDQANFLKRLCDVFEVTPEEIMGEEKPCQP